MLIFFIQAEIPRRSRVPTKLWESPKATWWVHELEAVASCCQHHTNLLYLSRVALFLLNALTSEQSSSYLPLPKFKVISSSKPSASPLLLKHCESWQHIFLRVPSLCPIQANSSTQALFTALSSVCNWESTAPGFTLI